MSNQPQAYITVRKSRLRTEKSTVYLTANTEFEIELYNPTTDRVGVEITINGKTFGSKLILRPGETQFLERYLDESRKFKFDTYFVDGSSETKAAIRNNGGIQIRFYRERVVPHYFPNNPIVINHNHQWYSNPNPVYYNGTGNHDRSVGFGSLSSSTANLFDFQCNASNTMNCSNLADEHQSNLRSKSFLSKASIDPTPEPIETGRVEKGSHSNQNFKSIEVELESWAFHTVSLKLLPVSQKPDDAVLYCSNCGRRARGKENFCPKCGTKHQ